MAEFIGFYDSSIMRLDPRIELKWAQEWAQLQPSLTLTPSNKLLEHIVNDGRGTLNVAADLMSVHSECIHRLGMADHRFEELFGHVSLHDAYECMPHFMNAGVQSMLFAYVAHFI